MTIPKPILSITKPIMLGLVLCLLALPYASKLSVAKQSVWDIEPLPEHLVTDEIKLLYYYIFLKEERFRDILTKVEVTTIVEELQKTQPKALDKLLHHDIAMFIPLYNKRLSVTQLSPNPTHMRYHLNYEYNDIKYKISFSPTIEQAWLRGRTEEWRTNLLPEFPENNGLLFADLAHTNNNNMIPLIQFFLDNGVDINVGTPYYNDTIFTFVGTLEMAQFLLSNGANPKIITDNNDTLLWYAVSRERSNELIKLLIDLGVDLHVKSSFFGTALDTAKDKVKGLESSIWRMENSSDSSPGDEFLPARLEKAEEVVRIIEQALEAEKKSAK